MLDSLEILTTSGIVLWSRHNAPVNASIINSLISDVFIEERLPSNKSANALNTFKREKKTVKWTILKELGIIFVAVYQHLLHLSWVDDLLEVVRDVFVKDYRASIEVAEAGSIDCSDFDRTYDAILAKLDKIADSVQDEPPSEGDSETDLMTPEESNDEPDVGRPNIIRPDATKPDKDRRVAQKVTKADLDQAADTSKPSSPAVNNHLLVAKSASGRPSRRGRQSPATVSSGDEASPRRPTNGKAKRTWDASGVATQDDGSELDYSSAAAASDLDRDSSLVDGIDAAEMGSRRAKGEFILKDLGDEVDAIIAKSKSSKQEKESTIDSPDSKQSGGIGAYFRSMVSGKTLSKQDLVKPLKDLEDHLVEKNVAREAAVRLCDSVERDLIGYKTAGGFSSKSILPSFYHTHTLTGQTPMRLSASQCLKPWLAY